MTWPTITVAMFRVLATRISAAATSLTWVTPPGTPSTSAAPIVWTESITSSCGRTSLDVAEHRAEVGLGGEVELVVDAAGAVGAQPHLGGRLLAGDVERAQPRAGGLRGHLEQQRRLADAGLAGQQHRGAGHQAAAEHPVELGHAAGAGQGVLDRDLPDRHRGRGHRAGLGAALRGRRLRDAAPRLALAAAADPLRGLPAALAAAVRRTGRGLGTAHDGDGMPGHRQAPANPPPAPATSRRTPRPMTPRAMIGTIHPTCPGGTDHDDRRIESAPTLATVAAEAGVSRQTVSNALNSPELLRPDTLERVQAAIERLGYSPNRAARSLRTRSSHLIGLRGRAGRRGQRQRADGPLRALAGGQHPRRGLPRAAVLRRAAAAARRGGGGGPADPVAGYDELLRSAAVDAFVVTDTYRGNPQAAWLTRQGRAVRGLRPALGRARRRAPVGRRRRPGRRRARGRPPRRARPHPDRLGRLEEGLLHRRGPAQRLDRPDARARAVHQPAQRPRRGPPRLRPPGRPRAARHRAADRASCASATPWRWGCCARWPSGA